LDGGVLRERQRKREGAALHGVEKDFDKTGEQGVGREREKGHASYTHLERFDLSGKTYSIKIDNLCKAEEVKKQGRRESNQKMAKNFSREQKKKGGKLRKGPARRRQQTSPFTGFS